MELVQEYLNLTASSNKARTELIKYIDELIERNVYTAEAIYKMISRDQSSSMYIRNYLGHTVSPNIVSSNPVEDSWITRREEIPPTVFRPHYLNTRIDEAIREMGIREMFIDTRPSVIPTEYTMDYLNSPSLLWDELEEEED